MPAPIAKGIIIAASVLVAAGIALSQNEQFRQWVEQSRRKVAMALHSLGDEIHPTKQKAEEEVDGEERKRRKRREELARRNKEHMEMEDRQNRSRGFDDWLGDDGKLRTECQNVEKSGVEAAEGSVRQRGRGARGYEAGALCANPFMDEEVLFDQSLIGTDKDEITSDVDVDEKHIEQGSRESTATLADRTSTEQQQCKEHTQPLIEVASPLAVGVAAASVPASSAHEAQVTNHNVFDYQLHSPNLNASTTSFYSASSDAGFDDDSSVGELISRPDTPVEEGVATPTSASFSTSASLAGTSSEHGEDRDDVMSLASDLGINTPDGWSEVASELGSEDDFPRR